MSPTSYQTSLPRGQIFNTELLSCQLLKQHRSIRGLCKRPKLERRKQRKDKGAEEFLGSPEKAMRHLSEAEALHPSPHLLALICEAQRKLD